MTPRWLEVLRTGPLSTVQDLGRPGHGHLGVTPSGAADRGALRLANRLVGNPEGAAGIEVTLGGLAVRAPAGATVAVTGATVPVSVDGGPAGHGAVLGLHSGALLELGPADAGLRAYLAVRGGVAVEPVLGSRSTDLLSGIGPPVLAAGDRLPVGAAADRWPVVEQAPVPPPVAGEVRLAVLPGPRAVLLGPAALDALLGTRWAVSPDSDRIGLRLAGRALPVDGAAPAPPSEGTVRGAVQVPPDGHPVAFLADHPVTGGYPVLAVLTEVAADRAAQLRPGQPLRLHRAPDPPPL